MDDKPTSKASKLRPHVAIRSGLQPFLVKKVEPQGADATLRLAPGRVSGSRSVEADASPDFVVTPVTVKIGFSSATSPHPDDVKTLPKLSKKQWAALRAGETIQLNVKQVSMPKQDAKSAEPERKGGYRAASGRYVSPSERKAAARARVVADEGRGVDTEAWIRELASSEL